MSSAYSLHLYFLLAFQVFDRFELLEVLLLDPFILSLLLSDLNVTVELHHTTLRC
jgi:hypothetical protein